MNNVLQQIVETNSVTAPDGETIPLHSQVARAEGEFLQHVIEQVRPRVSLEVGLAYGVSALYICEALAQVGAERHWVIDPHQFGVSQDELVGQDQDSVNQGWRGIGMHNLEQAGYGSLVKLLNAPSYRALPQLEADGVRLDFAFIDGWHTFDYTLVDFFYIDRMLRVGGVVVFDDTTYTAVRKVCRYVATNRAYTPFDPQTVTPPTPAQQLLSSLAQRTPLRRALKPRLTEPDFQIGLPERNYIAFRKEQDDILGDKPGARRWDFHHDF